MEKNKFHLSKLFLVFFIAFSMLFITPNFTNIVSAAIPITIDDFESYNVGVESGSNDYCSWESITAGEFYCSNNRAKSGTKSIYTYDGENDQEWHIKGYVNLSDTYSYIGELYFWQWQYENYNNIYGFHGESRYSFYTNNDTKVLDIKVKGDYNAITYYTLDSESNWNLIYNTASSAFRRINVEHITGNEINVSVWNDTACLGYHVDSCPTIYDWTTFSYITISLWEYGDEPKSNFDDLTIDTTYTGPPDEIPEGYLGVNCFNESSAENITEFNVLIVNEEGESYFDYYVNNTWVVWGDLLPQGDAIVTVSKTGYYPRSYSLTIEDGYFVIGGDTYTEVLINAYLPSINLSHLYYIQVVDDYLNPVEDARVKILGFCGNTSYQNVSDTFTDSLGYTQAYLLFGKEYYFSISKTGYENKTEKRIMDPSKYGIDYPIVFKIHRTWDEGPPIEPIYMDRLTLSAYNSTTMLIYYLNLNYDNDYVNFTVHDYFNNSGILAYYNVSSYPNNISLYFTHGDFNLSGDIIKVIAIAHRTNGSNYTIIRYFNINRNNIGAGITAILSIISIGFCLFGLTLAHPKTILGVVGMVIMIIGIAITAFADQSIWYIHLIQAIELILLIFIVLVFKEEGIHVV